MIKKIRPLLLILLVLAAPALAQKAPNAKAALELPAGATLDAKLTKVRAAIVRNENLLLAADPARSTGLRQQLALNRKLEVAYQSQQAGLKRAEALTQDLNLQQTILAGEVRQQLTQPPYSLSEYDRLLDELDAVNQQQKTAQASIKIEASAIDEALVAIEKAKQTLRAVKDADSDTDVAALDLELAEATLDRHKIAKSIAQLELKLAETKAGLATEKVDWTRQHLAYDAKDLNVQLRNIFARRAAALRQQ